MKIVAVPVLLSVFFISNVTSLSDQFINSNNLFTADLYKEVIKKKTENVLVSPISAEIILALAQSGAKNETAEEIRSCLHLPDTDQKTRSTIKELLDALKGNGNFSLDTANKIYVQENFPIKDHFKKIATDDYRAEVENIDFSQSQDAANTINQWVENQTNNKIKNLVDPSILNGGTPAILINALYFKAKWTNIDFYKSPIRKKSFYKTAKDVIQVDYMSDYAGEYNFYENPELGAKFLELPFKGKEAHMVFVLPNRKDGLGALEVQAEKVFSVQPFKQEVIDINLPLFKIESTIDFKEILQKMGVRKAFSQNEADFSGIAGNKGDLAIDGVMQKTFINVSRDGVEAAAATNIWFYMSGPPPPTKTFIADHPFIFYIKVKDVILFVGKVTSPSY